MAVINCVFCGSVIVGRIQQIQPGEGLLAVGIADGGRVDLNLLQAYPHLREQNLDRVLVGRDAGARLEDVAQEVVQLGDGEFRGTD